jgi:cell fate regulator YaaT (PSP1 superfamily)
VVETDWGVGMGDVQSILDQAPAEALKPPIRRILRKATPTDLSRRTALDRREQEARAFCRERIQARGLPMKLTEVRIGLDSSKAMLYFTAEGRVDFRELVKDLTQYLRTRVELRQIGVRDEATVLGSAGPCGRSLCCRTFLQGFAPVGIRMAKDQNLALNPAKLSGMCGRLKCCLAFEHPLYAELKRTVPKVGCCVVTCRGLGLVRSQNILEETVVIGLETGGQVTLKAGEVKVRPRPEAPARGHRRVEHRPEGPLAEEQAGRPPAPTDPEGGVPTLEQKEQHSEPDDIPADLAALEDS